MDFKLEVVVIPVSDVDRASDFYKTLGWRLDADVVGDNDFRLVQLTPPGSLCSIHFGTGLTTAAPGTAQATAPRRQRHRGGARRARRARRRREPRVPLRNRASPAGTARPRVRPACPAERRSAPPTRRSRRSPTPTATAGCCRRSRPDCPVVERERPHGCRDAGRAPARDGRTPRRVRGARRSTTGGTGTRPTSTRASTAARPRRRLAPPTAT